MQRCTKCLEEKPDDQFQQKSRQGRRCLVCFRVAKRETSHRYHASPKGRATIARRYRKWVAENADLHRQRAFLHYRKRRDIMSNAPHSAEASEVWAREAITRARARSKKKGMDFDLMASDLLPLPVHCPALGIELVYAASTVRKKGPKPDSASLDRLNSELGYVRDNVQIISHRANSIKADATVTELEMLVDFLYREMI